VRNFNGKRENEPPTRLVSHVVKVRCNFRLDPQLMTSTVVVGACPQALLPVSN